MRLTRWAFFVVLLSALVPLSCRKTVAPNTDRNRAPETYLTAAPLDSIGGGLLNRAPYRFHVHWSGSDIDGQVVGYYIAVTETLPPQPEDPRPLPLPPPKPQSWHFTTRTDSVFVFNVFEGLGHDRDHGLYIFAVDNEGKADPTPAFTRFSARDQNLPGIVWKMARAEGTIFVPAPGGGVVPVHFEKQLTDGPTPQQLSSIARDTIPLGAAVYFAWQGYDEDWGSSIRGYRYKLYENDFVKTDSTVTSAEYATGVGNATTPLPTGTNFFRVRALDDAGGTTDPDSTRRFVVNFDPDTWWAGPDINDPDVAPSVQHDGRGYYVSSPDGSPPAALDKWLGAGRFCVLPADRKPMRTFVERVQFPGEFRYYIHADGDTVARNATDIYLFAGGSDKDSPYDVLIQPGNPPTDKCVVGIPGPANGSPIGFDFRVVKFQVVDGSRNQPAFSNIKPNFNPIAAGFDPEVYYDTDQPSFFTGTAYAQVRAADSPSGRDRRMGDPLDYIKGYNANPPTVDTTLRPLVMVWNFNYRPYFNTEIADFGPKPDTLLTDAVFTAKLYMTDPDSTSAAGRPGFLVRARVVDPNAPPPGDNQFWSPDLPFFMRSGDPFQISIPTDSPPGLNYIEIEMSDDPVPSLSSALVDRRIIRVKFPFYWQTRP